jgi:hypothetical protein
VSLGRCPAPTGTGHRLGSLVLSRRSGRPTSGRRDASKLSPWEGLLETEHVQATYRKRMGTVEPVYPRHPPHRAIDTLLPRRHLQVFYSMRARGLEPPRGLPHRLLRHATSARIPQLWAASRGWSVFRRPLRVRCYPICYPRTGTDHPLNERLGAQGQPWLRRSLPLDPRPTRMVLHQLSSSHPAGDEGRANIGSPRRARWAWWEDCCQGRSKIDPLAPVEN